MSKTFLPWLDLADYTALSGADFETGAAGWSLDGSAVTRGNEPYHVGGAGDSKSLALSSGDSATSPAICVGITHPTIRFFAKRRSGGLVSLSTLRVDVLFETAGRWPMCLGCPEGPVHSLYIQPDLGGPDPVWVCEETGEVAAALGYLGHR